MKYFSLHSVGKPMLLASSTLLFSVFCKSTRPIPSPNNALPLAGNDALYPTSFSNYVPSNNRDINPVASTLGKRRMTDINCLEATGQSSWGRAPLDAIQDGIKYLRTSHGGNKACGAPPHTCVRISCSWHGGIHLCNNNAYHLEKKCSDIAEYAQALVDECTYKDGVGQKSVGGQAWDVENWNVIVKVENC